MTDYTFHKFCAYIGASLAAFAGDLSGLGDSAPPESKNPDCKPGNKPDEPPNHEVSKVKVRLTVEHYEGTAYLTVHIKQEGYVIGFTSAEFKIVQLAGPSGPSSELSHDFDSIVTGRDGWTERYDNSKYGAFAHHARKITDSGLLCTIAFDISNFGPEDAYGFEIQDFFLGNTVEGVLIDGRSLGVPAHFDEPVFVISIPAND